VISVWSFLLVIVCLVGCLEIGLGSIFLSVVLVFFDVVGDCVKDMYWLSGVCLLWFVVFMVVMIWWVM